MDGPKSNSPQALCATGVAPAPPIVPDRRHADFDPGHLRLVSALRDWVVLAAIFASPAIALGRQAAR
jgi:hypothetical protein